MKLILFVLLLFTSCATVKKDPLQDNLSQYVSKCMCLMKLGTELESWQINWKDRASFEEQIQECKCEMRFRMDDIAQPLDYIKPNTTFYRQHRDYPWKPEQIRIEQIN